MITKLKTHESVPIGGNNFESFLEYVRGFLGANFWFSANAPAHSGGHFFSDAFDYVNAAALVDGAPTDMYFFSPTVEDVGNMFGMKNREYYRFEVLKVDFGQHLEPQILKWELLATSSDNTDVMRYRNTDANNMRLPYRPVRKAPSGNYEYGYQEIRINGVPQDRFQLSYVPFTMPSAGNPVDFSTQDLTFQKIALGAEFPEPVKEGRYKPAQGLTNNILQTDYDNTLVFSYSNFSIDFGGHILLWREPVADHHLFSYVRQDLSSGDAVAPGRFKVLDYAKGVIKLNLTLAQLEELVVSGEVVPDLNDLAFSVVSAEQLKEETTTGITGYYTRYGKIYDGETDDAVLAEYIFDGNTHLARHIPQEDYYSGSGEVLLQDVSSRYVDSIILGIKYYASPNIKELVKVQPTRYLPDTIQLYFHNGVSVPDTDDIRGVVEQNDSSWYNRDVRDAEYFPVSRAQESYVAFVHKLEADAFFTDGFTPHQHFFLGDTLALVDLKDVDENIGDGQVLVYDANTEIFSGVDYKLGGLLDVDFTGGTADGHVIQYQGGEWYSRDRSTAFSGVTGFMSYDSATATALGQPGTPAESLATKGYVDSNLDDATVVRTVGDYDGVDKAKIGGLKTFTQKVTLESTSGTLGAAHALHAGRKITPTTGIEVSGGEMDGSSVTLRKDFTLGIGQFGVSLDRLVKGSKLTVIGNPLHTDNQPFTEITASAAGDVLQVVPVGGSNQLRFGPIDIVGGIGAGTIAISRLENVGGYTVLGRPASGTGPVSAIGSAANNTVLGKVGSNNLAFSKINNAQISDRTAVSVMGRSATTGGGVADIVAGDDSVLRRNEDALGFGKIGANHMTASANHTIFARNSGSGVVEISAGDNTVLTKNTSSLGFRKVSLAMITDTISAYSVLGRKDAAGSPETIAAGTNSVLRRNSGAIGFGTINSDHVNSTIVQSTGNQNLGGTKTVTSGSKITVSSGGTIDVSNGTLIIPTV